GAEFACRCVSAYTYDTLLRHAAERCRFPLKQERVRRWIQPDLRFKSLHEWVLWIPEMDFPRQIPIDRGANVKYIGPSVHSGRREPGVETYRRAGATYLVYVAVGTARFRWSDNVAFLRKVMAAFATVADVSVVISTSDARATAALGAAPSNVRV